MSKNNAQGLKKYVPQVSGPKCFQKGWGLLKLQRPPSSAEKQGSDKQEERTGFPKIKREGFHPSKRKAEGTQETMEGQRGGGVKRYASVSTSGERSTNPTKKKRRLKPQVGQNCRAPQGRPPVCCAFVGGVFTAVLVGKQGELPRLRCLCLGAHWAPKSSQNQKCRGGTHAFIR